MGSIVGNLLLVLGFTLLFGRTGDIDRRSAYVSLGLVGLATVLVLIPSVPGFHGDPDRRSLAALSLPLRRSAADRPRDRDPPRASPAAAALFVRRAGRRRLALSCRRRRARARHRRDRLLTETLVGTLQAFATQAHLSEFFVAIVIVAIVGNATEHGSAVLLARRGRVKLAVEIPLASSAQIAGLLIPLVALISWSFEPLALSFRPVELVAMGVAALLPAIVLAAGRTTRLGGTILLLAYSVLVALLPRGRTLRAGDTPNR